MLHKDSWDVLMDEIEESFSDITNEDLVDHLSYYEVGALIPEDEPREMASSIMVLDNEKTWRPGGQAPCELLMGFIREKGRLEIQKGPTKDREGHVGYESALYTVNGRQAHIICLDGCYAVQVHRKDVDFWCHAYNWNFHPMNVMLSEGCKVFENECFLVAVNRNRVINLGKFGNSMDWDTPVRSEPDLVAYLRRVRKNGLKQLEV